MKGRKPVPTALRLVKGGRKPKATRAAPAMTDAPVMPAFLTGEAREEWDRIAGDLHLCGYVTRFDAAALGAYCQAFGRWAQAERALAESPELVVRTTNGNTVQSVLVGVANKAMADMLRYASELGLTPVSRSRVSPTPPPAADDPTSIYFPD